MSENELDAVLVVNSNASGNELCDDVNSTQTASKPVASATYMSGTALGLILRSSTTCAACLHIISLCHLSLL